LGREVVGLVADDGEDDGEEDVTDGGDDSGSTAGEDGEDDGGEGGGSDESLADDGEDDGEDGGEDVEDPSFTIPEDEDPSPETLVEDVPEVPIVTEPVEETPVTTSTPASFGSNETKARARQQDIKLDCQMTGVVHGDLVKYGCKSFLKQGGYYGIVVGWWHMIRPSGERIRFKSLLFRDGGFDVSFWVKYEESVTGITAVPAS
jgi:hypothetical protein